MTYAELSEFGKLRKMHRCGPVSMYQRLLPCWLGSHSAVAIADKVKHFFKRYGQHRHKLTTLTPAYHAESYSPDDNRFDLRQFLYPRWERQFESIDAITAQVEGRRQRWRRRRKKRARWYCARVRIRVLMICMIGVFARQIPAAHSEERAPWHPGRLKALEKSWLGQARACTFGSQVRRRQQPRRRRKPVRRWSASLMSVRHACLYAKAGLEEAEDVARRCAGGWAPGAAGGARVL